MDKTCIKEVSFMKKMLPKFYKALSAITFAVADTSYYATA